MKFSYKIMQLIFLPFLIVSSAILQCNPFFSGEEENSSEDLLLALALGNSRTTGGNSYKWDLPPGFPVPRVPEENPMTQEKVELGRFLFYEKKLSGDNTMSCGSCHFQHLAFADDKAQPRGIAHSGNPMGDFHPRNAQPLFNVAYNTRQTWNNILLITLEQQAHGPLFGEDPVELGLLVEHREIREKLLSATYPDYNELFQKAFPEERGSSRGNRITVGNIIKAIASFQRSLISGNSAFDKATYQGDRTAMSASARRGFNFFSSEIAECFHCHDGVNFNDSTFHENTSAVIEPLFHNNALYQIPGTGNVPNNMGLESVTGERKHRGGFKAPSLRNVGLTFPYMHDGSISCDDDKNPHLPEGKSKGATMEGCARQALGRVLDHYSNGGFNSTCSAFAEPGGTRNPSFPCSPHITEYGGDSNLAPNPQDTVDTTLIRRFPMSEQEREDLINFLFSLTDEEFIQDPRFSDPF